MGPPGSGKGTQATIIAARYTIPAISTGEIFRRHVAARTPLGVEAQRYMQAGEYVPDSLTNRMVRERLGQHDCTNGFLLDGYPRTVAQVHELDRMLEDQGHQLDGAVVLYVERDKLVQRLLQRARSESRLDDTEEVIRRRQEVYTEVTAPLIESYSRRGLVLEVDGTGKIDEVARRLIAALAMRPRGTG
jgi:adenylate kinase